MQADALVKELIVLSTELHPNYSHTQHLLWVLGFLATVVMEKNLMDTVVFARLDKRIEQLKSYI